MVQGAVFPTSDETLLVITSPGTVGGPYTVEVENPGGSIATSQFSYVPRADPVVTSASPNSGTALGGDVVTLTGTNFSAASAVSFGVDPLTGTGGTPAAEVHFVDANTIEVTTPAMAGGTVSVLVSEGSTDQADVLVGGFTVQAVQSDGGGGCHVVPVQGPPSSGDLLRWLLFMAFLALAARSAHRLVPQAA